MCPAPHVQAELQQTRARACSEALALVQMGETSPWDLDLQLQGRVRWLRDGRTPGNPEGRSGGSAGHRGASACTRSSTEAVVPQSCVCLRVLASAEQPVLAGGHPGTGKKKLFWSPAHAPLLTEQCWAVASPSRRGGEHRGALTLISFTDIKGLSKAEMMPCHHCCWHNGSICTSTTGAEPQCTIATRCQHHSQPHCMGPISPGTPRPSLPGTATAHPYLPPLA